MVLPHQLFNDTSFMRGDPLTDKVYTLIRAMKKKLCFI